MIMNIIISIMQSTVLSKGKSINKVGSKTCVDPDSKNWFGPIDSGLE